MVTEATSGNHLVDQQSNMVYIAHDGQVPKTVWFEFSRDKKKQINVSHNFNFLGASCQAMGASLCDWFFLGDCHFLPAILPQVWLLIHKSMFSTMLTHFLSAWLTRQARERERGGHRPTTGTQGVEVLHPGVDQGGSYHPLIFLHAFLNHAWKL